MKQLRLAVVAAALALAAAPAVAAEITACPPPGQWRDAMTGATPTAGAVMGRLAAADVILLGESHGVPDVHLWQATTAAAIAARRGGAQFGYEMLPRSAQAALDAWAEGEATLDAFLAEAGWAAVWGFPAAVYDPILRLPRVLNAPAIALNVDRALVRQVGQAGWAAVPEADRRGLGDPAPALPAYELKLAEVIAAKAKAAAAEAAERPKNAHPPTALAPEATDDAGARDRFVDAQLVWDRAFAEAIVAARSRRPDRPVVAFIGSGHVDYGHGVVHQLADLGVFNVATAVPAFDGEDCGLHPDAAGRPVADFVFGLRRPDPGQDAPARPRIGVYIRDAKDGGAEISNVRPDTPAAAAGFRAGDVIVEAAGQPVAGAGDLGSVIRSHMWGAWLPFMVRREGATIELIAKLPPRPPA